MSDQKHKPCPFCRHAETRVKSRRYRDATLYSVECVNCAALGPLGACYEDARKEWNGAKRK